MKKEPELVTITKLEYLKLQLRNCELDILEANGVDNWGEYGGFSDDEEYASLEKEIEELTKKEKSDQV